MDDHSDDGADDSRARSDDYDEFYGTTRVSARMRIFENLSYEAALAEYEKLINKYNLSLTKEEQTLIIFMDAALTDREWSQSMWDDAVAFRACLTRQE